MWDIALFRASIALAIASAAGTATLAGTLWWSERPGRRGAAPALVTLGMVVAAIYHIGLASIRREPLVLESLLILCYLLLATALLVTLAQQRDGEFVTAAPRPGGSNAILMVGIVLFAVVAPLLAIAGPPLYHLTHGVAGLVTGAGVYRPVGGAGSPPTNASDAEQRRPDWVVPTDRAILSLLRSSELVLTPAVIAFNLDRSRAEVNRRLRKLEAAGAVERVERGKYRIAT